MRCKEITMIPPELMDKTVLCFDFDGTLADTERFHAMARNSILKKYGVRVWDWSRYLGKSDTEVFMMLDKKFRIGLDVSAIVEEKTKLSKELIILGNVTPFPTVEAVIKTASGKKYIITEQEEAFVSFFLQKWGLLRMFDKVISLADEIRSKSDMIVSLKIATDDGVLFDDMLSVLEEATKQGLHAVLVKDGNFSLVLQDQ